MEQVRDEKLGRVDSLDPTMRFYEGVEYGYKKSLEALIEIFPELGAE
jgi:hypothetical protein